MGQMMQHTLAWFVFCCFLINGFTAESVKQFTTRLTSWGDARDGHSGGVMRQLMHCLSLYAS